jgi:DNA-binding MarR family transcriptional regulator
MISKIQDLETYKEMNSLLLMGISHGLNLFQNKIFEPYGITGKQAGILSFLMFNKDKELTQKDFEHEFNLRPSTINSVLTYLEDGGFISRSVSKTDARAKIVTANEKSKQIFNEIINCTDIQENLIVQGFSAAEQEQLHDFLTRIINNVTNV